VVPKDKSYRGKEEEKRREKKAEVGFVTTRGKKRRGERTGKRNVWPEHRATKEQFSNARSITCRKGEEGKRGRTTGIASVEKKVRGKKGKGKRRLFNGR